MTPTSAPGRPEPLLAIVLTCLGALAGCGDADADPMAVLVAAETHGALAAAEHLPELTELTSRSKLGEAADLWDRSWSASDEEARVLRSTAYRAALPTLAPDLGRGGVAKALGEVQEVLAASASLDPTLVPPFVQEGLRVGEALAADAARALGNGDLESALLHTLEASDRLRELAPREVAARLLASATRALGRNPADPSYSELDLERGTHLLVSAGEAFDGGDYLRAIRRAYYACRLLGVALE